MHNVHRLNAPQHSVLAFQGALGTEYCEQYSLKEVLMSKNGPIDFAQRWAIYIKRFN